MTNSGRRDFDEHGFRERLSNAQTNVQKILTATKASLLHPAEDVHHSYNDKYQLVEQGTRCALTALINAWLAAGFITSTQLQQLVTW